MTSASQTDKDSDGVKMKTPMKTLTMTMMEFSMSSIIVQEAKSVGTLHNPTTVMETVAEMTTKTMITTMTASSMKSICVRMESQTGERIQLTITMVMVASTSVRTMMTTMMDFSDIIDFCPLQEGTATQGGMKGCPDFDEDGWADTADAFFQDETQWSDGDGDGFGDNPAGNNPDDCPFFFGNSSMDRIGCIDSDGDGYSDPEIAWSVAQGADAFVDEPTQWADADGDGYGDNFEGVTVDFCTNDAGTSSIDRFGCPDLDGDGYSDPDAFWTYNKWESLVMDLICSLSTLHSGLIQTTMVLVITGVTQNGTNLG